MATKMPWLRVTSWRYLKTTKGPNRHQRRAALAFEKYRARIKAKPVTKGAFGVIPEGER